MVPASPPARMHPVIHYVTYVGISAHACFIALFAWLHVPTLAAFNIYSVAAWVLARRLNAHGRRRTAAAVIVTEVTAHAVLAVSLLGWDSGFHYYLIPLIPFLVFDDDLPNGLVVGGSTLVALVYLGLRWFAPGPTAFPPWLQPMNIAVPLLALGIISYYFRLASLDAERRMADLAMTDALTQLPNRRHLRALLEQEAVRFERSGRVFSVMIGDVDGFKAINDGRGHESGDRVLGALAELLRGAVRAQDQVARWGGEEFLVLLPETDFRGAGTVAEKLRAAVEQRPLDVGGVPVRITMTFGVAQAISGGTVEECLRRADRALYEGKLSGKNRVVVDSAVLELALSAAAP